MKGMEDIAGNIVAKLSPGETEVEVEGDPGLISAAEDVIAAVEAKDAQGLSDALEAHYAMCKAKEYSETPTEA